MHFEPDGNDVPIVSESLVQESLHAIDRGVQWLSSQQSEDGGWHSQTYGAMRGGAAMTALALFTGSHLPIKFHSMPHWKRGLEFLMQGIRRRGFAACPDGTLDYPTYSTAMTLIATRRMDMAIASTIRKSMIDFLIASQLTEANGFDSNELDYGGWDSLAGSDAVGITSGTNVSLTYYAVEAIAGESHVGNTELMKTVIQWSRRIQNWPEGDGGFFFEPTSTSLNNKAQWHDEACQKARSYGTATCDGLCLMQAAGVPRNEERFQRAIDWLVESTQNEGFPKQGVAGFEKSPPEHGWKDGLKYYYYLGLSRSMHLLPSNTQKKLCTELIKHLIDQQTREGLWENASANMREDDAYIATSFAMIAISILIR